MEPKPHYLPTDQIEAEEALKRSTQEAAVRDELDPLISSLFSILVTKGVIKINLLTEEEVVEDPTPYIITHGVSRNENCFINLDVYPDLIPKDQNQDSQVLIEAIEKTIDLYWQLRSFGAKFEVNL